MEKAHQARLSVVTADGDLAEPRRYAQSTSGRKTSQRMCPPLSRSISTTSDSRMRSPVDITLRRYPTVVLQRPAKDSCSARSSELRYERSISDAVTSDAIGSGVLPNSKIQSIPFGNLPNGMPGYDAGMEDPKKLNKHLGQLRFKNFSELLHRQYGDSPTVFCSRTGYNSATTVSQLKTRKKSFGADLARELEMWAGLDRYELEKEDMTRPFRAGGTSLKDWPFTISPEQFLSLQGKTRREIDDTLTRLVIGAQAQEVINKPRRAGS